MEGTYFFLPDSSPDMRLISFLSLSAMIVFMLRSLMTAGQEDGFSPVVQYLCELSSGRGLPSLRPPPVHLKHRLQYLWLLLLMYGYAIYLLYVDYNLLHDSIFSYRAFLALLLLAPALLLYALLLLFYLLPVFIILVSGILLSFFSSSERLLTNFSASPVSNSCLFTKYHLRKFS
ncbi:MAG: hypothetical protein Q9N34_00675 [Aquificota bacterium]|nr:hypothetical protein [Aquificota bacterium]